MQKDFHEIKRIITDILFPQRCVSCGALLSEREKRFGFCKKCMKIIRPVHEPVCKKCGKPLDSENEEYCEDCMSGNRRHSFVQGKTLFLYSGPMREVMYRFKYGNRRCYADSFARVAKAMHGRWLKRNGIDLIIPVPMFPAKQKRRGYNQAEEFAKALSRETKIPESASILHRTKNTAVMKGLTEEMRRDNLKNAFHINGNLVQSKRILLVDDIYTTGSTADAASQCLQASGAEAVYCLYICIGDGRKRRKA